MAQGPPCPDHRVLVSGPDRAVWVGPVRGCGPAPSRPLCVPVAPSPPTTASPVAAPEPAAAAVERPASTSPATTMPPTTTAPRSNCGAGSFGAAAAANEDAPNGHTVVALVRVGDGMNVERHVTDHRRRPKRRQRLRKRPNVAAADIDAWCAPSSPPTPTGLRSGRSTASRSSRRGARRPGAPVPASRSRSSTAACCGATRTSTSRAVCSRVATSSTRTAATAGSTRTATARSSPASSPRSRRTAPGSPAGGARHRDPTSPRPRRGRQRHVQHGRIRDHLGDRPRRQRHQPEPRRDQPLDDPPAGAAVHDGQGRDGRDGSRQLRRRAVQLERRRPRHVPRPRTPSNVPGTIAVGASATKLIASRFSTHGPYVNLVAPGVGIISTWGVATTSYAQGDGTSFAAPYVAASVADPARGVPGRRTRPGSGFASRRRRPISAPRAVTTSPVRASCARPRRRHPADAPSPIPAVSPPRTPGSRRRARRDRVRAAAISRPPTPAPPRCPGSRRSVRAARWAAGAARR